MGFCYTPPPLLPRRFPPSPPPLPLPSSPPPQSLPLGVLWYTASQLPTPQSQPLVFFIPGAPLTPLPPSYSGYDSNVQQFPSVGSLNPEPHQLLGVPCYTPPFEEFNRELDRPSKRLRREDLVATRDELVAIRGDLLESNKKLKLIEAKTKEADTKIKEVQLKLSKLVKKDYWG